MTLNICPAGIGLHCNHMAFTYISKVFSRYEYRYVSLRNSKKKLNYPTDTFMFLRKLDAHMFILLKIMVEDAGNHLPRLQPLPGGYSVY